MHLVKVMAEQLHFRLKEVIAIRASKVVWDGTITIVVSLKKHLCHEYKDRVD